MEQKLLTVKELANYLGVNRFTLYRWVQQQKIPHRRVGLLIRFDLREVEEFMRRRPTVKIHAEAGR